MANYTNTQDLKQAVLTNCGELSDGSSEYDARAVTYLNKLYLAVHAGSSEYNLDCGDAWLWCRAPTPGNLTLDASLFLNANVTNGSQYGSFMVAPAVSYQGWHIRFEDTDFYDTYKIIAHVAGQTAFQLEDKWIQDTVANGSMHLMHLDYVLDPTGGGSKIMRLMEPFTCFVPQSYDSDRDYEIFGVEPPVLQKRFPISKAFGQTPVMFSQILAVDGVKTVRFSNFVINTMRVQYNYIPVPNDLVDSDTNIPDLPREFRDFLESGATYKLMLDKDDDRSQVYLQMAQQKLNALVKAQRKEVGQASNNRGRLIPRLDEYLNSRSKSRYW